MIMRIPALHMLVRKAADWDESKHPRADNGQFGSGSGGSSKPKKPSKTRRKMERREEAASQARVGGAIQSLLSGGSALDKIGWLKTSEKPVEGEEKPAMDSEKPSRGGKKPLRDITTETAMGPNYGFKENENYRAYERDRAGRNYTEPTEYRTSNKTQEESDRNKFLDLFGAHHPPKPTAKPKEEAAPAKEPSILDTINQRNEQAASMRGKVPSMEHPSQRDVREGRPEGGHSPRVLTQAERDYRDNQRQTEDARRRAGVPIPGDQLATLEIPGKIKVEDGELAGSKILSLGNKRAGVMQHADGRFVVLSQVDRKTVDRKEFKHLDEANRYAEAWLKGGQPEKPKVEEKPKLADKVKSAKHEIANNIASGKLKKETVVAAVKTMYERANEAERRGDDKTAKELDLRAQIMIDGAGIKGELYSAGILQMRGKPLISIGRGMETRSGKPRNYINSLETAHRIENYRNKVVSHGEVLDDFNEGETNISLYEYNGKTYLVDHDHPDQFSKISPDSWRRLKDDLTGDDEPATPPPHKSPMQSMPPRSPQVTEATSSDILQHGKKIDEHGKASLHEYNGGFYMVTQGKPMGLKISKPAWEGLKYS